MLLFSLLYMFFLGKMIPPGLHHDTILDDYHVFWANDFSGIGIKDNSTFLISAPTNDLTPVGVDFYEMRRR
jgi:hypothetical protein